MRKIVQLLQDDEYLTALCDDGTILMGVANINSRRVNWIKMDHDVPQPKKPNAIDFFLNVVTVNKDELRALRGTDMFRPTHDLSPAYNVPPNCVGYLIDRSNIYILEDES